MQKGVFMDSIKIEKPIMEVMTFEDLKKENESRIAKGMQIVIDEQPQKELETANDLDVLAITATKNSPFTIIDVKKIKNPEDFCNIFFK